MRPLWNCFLEEGRHRQWGFIVWTVFSPLLWPFKQVCQGRIHWKKYFTTPSRTAWLMFSHVFLLKYMCVFVRVCVCVCVCTGLLTVKDQMGSTCSTWASSPPQQLLPWRYRIPSRTGCRDDYPSPTSSCTTRMRSGTTWTRKRTHSHCWVSCPLSVLHTCCSHTLFGWSPIDYLLMLRLWTHFIWMVPYRLSTDAQIINTLYLFVPYRLSTDAQIINTPSVKTLLTTTFG